MSSGEGEPVDLYVYDLTHGMASLLSPAILGRQIEGVWHTGVVVFGREYFFGGEGITSCAPGSTQLGAPLRVERVGTTHVPRALFMDYVQGLAASSYNGASYNLLEHNCNNFSDELCQFLCGARLPKHILELPERALSPPLRAALGSLLAAVQGSAAAAQPVYAGGVRHGRGPSPDYVTLNSQIEEARQQSAQLEQRRSTLAEKLARKERRKEKKRHKMMARGHHPAAADLLDEEEMSEGVEVSAGGAVPEVSVAGPSEPAAAHSSLRGDLEERRRSEELRRQLEPPITFKDIDGAGEYEALSAALSSAELSAEESASVQELQQYLVQGEGSWALGDDFLLLVGRVLRGEVPGGGVEARRRVLRCLAAAALREDVALVLHQDRRDHALVNYAHDIDRLPLEEQRALALFICNLFEHISSSEWLLYISEWEHNNQQLSNIRVTTKVAVHSLLSEDPELQDIGTALMHNIAIKERFLVGKALRDLLPRAAKCKVFDDVCVELAMALLQFVSGAPGEEHLYRACRALARLAQHSHDVPQLCHVLAVSPDTFRGTSPRIDEQIDIFMTKVK